LSCGRGGRSPQSPHRDLERISKRVFMVEVDGKRFNVSVDRLKPAYSTAEQEKLPTNKPGTVQWAPNLTPMGLSSSKNIRSILKTYPSAMQSRNKKIVTFQRE